MRALVSLYLIVGLLLLVFGYFATGSCPNKNTDVANDVVFALTWPVGLYGYVINGHLTPQDWLHKQACEGGLGPSGAEPTKTEPAKTEPAKTEPANTEPPNTERR